MLGGFGLCLVIRRWANLRRRGGSRNQAAFDHDLGTPSSCTAPAIPQAFTVEETPLQHDISRFAIEAHRCGPCVRAERKCALRCPQCPASQKSWCCWKNHDSTVTGHRLARPVETMQCLVCGTLQPTAGACRESTCEMYGGEEERPVGASAWDVTALSSWSEPTPRRKLFARSVCMKCSVFTDEDVYHCDACGLCR